MIDLSIFGEFFFYQALIQQNESWNEEISSLKVKSGPYYKLNLKEIVMKKISMFVMIVLVSFAGLFANDLCEEYAKYMKKDEVFPVKIGECRRSLYKECEFYPEKRDLCIEVLHYGEEEKIFALK
ncbi:MAG TPA: hypothetical protein PKH95_00265 [Candidatus Magasanikbacteria bacterium]|nr:hypothetical protein [Candidatus Magasanikbacteria bacterium]